MSYGKVWNGAEEPLNVGVYVIKTNGEDLNGDGDASKGNGKAVNRDERCLGAMGKHWRAAGQR